MELSRFSEVVRAAIERGGTAVPGTLWRLAPSAPLAEVVPGVTVRGRDARIGRDVIVSTDHRDRRGDVIESKGIDTASYLTNPIVLLMHGRGAEHAVIGGNSKLSLTTVDGLPALRVDEFLFSDAGLGPTICSQWNERILRAASIAVLPQEWYPIDAAGDRLDPEDRRAARLMRGVRITRSEMVEWSIVTRGADAKSLGRDWNPETERARPFADMGSRTEDEEVERADGARYASILAFCGSTPWAMEPSTLLTVQSILAERAAGYRPTPEEIRARIGAREDEETEVEERARLSKENVQPSATGPVRVVSVIGPIMPRASMLSMSSTGVSADALRDQIRRAAADESVRAIVLDVDSPGGAVSLIPELATAIRAAREVKPVHAVANTQAASAAYWIAASATSLAVSPSGEVGSIGVYNMHQDISALEALAGRKTTLVKAGPYKAEANPYQPLSAEAKAEMQRKVDDFYGMFVEAVADGRGVAVETVTSTFGGGRMVLAKDAVRLKMADRVATLETVVAELEAQYAAPAAPAVVAPPQAPDVAAVAADGHAGGFLRRTSLEQCPGCVAVTPYVRDADGPGGEFVFHRTRAGAECDQRRASIAQRGPSFREIALMVRDALPQGVAPGRELPPEAREMILAVAAAGQVGALPATAARVIAAAGQVLQGRVLSAETRRLVEEALEVVGLSLEESRRAADGYRETVGALHALLTGAAPTADERPKGRPGVVASTPELRSALDRLNRAVK